MYHLRASTNWMRNAGPEYFYNQRIQVDGMQDPVQQSVSLNPDVQFFAEGGSLVNGIRSKIAVKARGTNGLGED